MKKFFPALIFLLLLVSFTFVNAQDPEPEKVPYGDWEAISNDTGLTLTVYRGTAEEPEIPAAIDGKAVTQLGKGLFQNNTTLRRVIIPDSVTVISNSAFNGCTSLEEVHLPGSLKKINNSVFRYCVNLERIDIPFSVKSVGAYAFADCLRLKEIMLLSVTTVGESAFDNCVSLTTVTASRKLTTVEANAFRDTAWLNAQNDAEFVFIGNDILIAWNGTGSVADIPYGTVMVSNAFDGKIQVEEVRLPETVRTIGKYAFRNAANLRSLSMPPFLAGIADGAFLNCRGLTAVALPATVTSVGANAFSGCTGLTEFAFPPRLTSLNDNVLANCKALTDIAVPASVGKISAKAFAGSPGIRLQVAYESEAERFARDHEIPYTYLIRESGDFLYTAGPDGVRIVRYVGNRRNVEIPGTIGGLPVTEIGTAAFQNNGRVRRVTLPPEVTSVGEWAFSYMEELELVQLPAGLTDIGANAFTGSQALSKICLPEGLRSVGEKAFDPAGYTALCVNENSDSAVLLRDMGFDIITEDFCTEDAAMTEQLETEEDDTTCNCDCV